MAYKTLLFHIKYKYCILLFIFFTSCHLDSKRNRPPGPISHSSPHNTRNSPHSNPRLTWSGRLDVTSHSQYRKLLKSHLICDRGSLINTGHYGCKSWDERADVHIQFTKTKLPAEATLTIQPYMIGMATYLTQSGFHSIRLKGQAHPIAETKGFRLTLGEPATHSQGHSLLPPTLNIVNVVVESEVSSPKKDAVLSVILYYGSTGKESSEFGQAELVNKTMDSNDSSGFSSQR